MPSNWGVTDRRSSWSRGADTFENMVVTKGASRRSGRGARGRATINADQFGPFIEGVEDARPSRGGRKKRG